MAKWLFDRETRNSIGLVSDYSITKWPSSAQEELPPKKGCIATLGAIVEAADELHRYFSVYRRRGLAGGCHAPIQHLDAIVMGICIEMQ